MRIARYLLILLTIGVLQGLFACAPIPTVKQGEEVTIKGKTFSFDKQSYPSKLHLFPEYHIVPGDQLDVLFQIRTQLRKSGAFKIAVDHTISVKFVNLPELNEVQNVHPDGHISLPYIGEVFVVGKTVEELTQELRGQYRTVFRDPELYVVIPEFSTQIKELKKDLHTSSRGLSRLVTVRPDGFATFPLLGDVFVAGKSVPQANEILDKKYEKVLPGLHTDLFLEQTTGSVVYVVGQVRAPGAYKIERPISVIQAGALAGGFTSEALLESAIIFRRKQREMVATGINLHKTLTGEENSRFFFLRPDDIVFIPRTRIATTAELMRQIKGISLFNGYSISFSGDLVDGAPFRWGNNKTRSND